MSLFLEIGPGRGDFLMAMAQAHPEVAFAAVEYKMKRHQKLQKRIERLLLKNITLYQGDARKVLPESIQDQSVHKMYILFSDPWPKRRHAPHRLFRQDFLEEIYRVLAPDGELYVAHDDPCYREEIKKLFQKNSPRFLSMGPWDILTMTFYGEKWLKEGKSLEFFYYRKIDTSSQDHLALPCVLPE